MAKQTVATSPRRTPPRSTRTHGASRRTRVSEQHTTWEIPLKRTNVLILLVGIGVVIIGYVLMASGIADNPTDNQGVWNNASTVSIAPILLTIGYCIIIPIALFYRKKGGDEAAMASAQESAAE